MRCAWCGSEAQHFWAVGVNVCYECSANLAAVVARDPEKYKELIILAVMRTLEGKEGEGRDDGD